jgi:hypothetical protein
MKAILWSRTPNQEPEIENEKADSNSGDCKLLEVEIECANAKAQSAVRQL